MPPSFSAQHPLSPAAGAQQDALDATINQTVFALAFALVGVVVLGACAYLCFVAVGRWRARAPQVVDRECESVQVQEGEGGLRKLILPRKVQADAKVPRRLILSPLYTVGSDLGGGSKDVWDGEEAEEEDEGRQTWRASLHAMGLAPDPVRHFFCFPHITCLRSCILAFT